MRRIRGLAIAFALGASAGCAYHDRDRVEGLDKMVLTGSHLAKWRCDTVDGSKSKARADQERMTERVIRNKPKLGSE